MSFYHLFSSVSTLLITYLIASTAVVAEPHPFLGPIYPPPINLLAEKLIQNTVANLSSSLIHVLRNGQSPWGNVSANTSSMSMHVASARDNRTLLDFNFASPALNKTGTQDVTADSVYRVGSVSKLFTVYALLLNAGGFEKWDDPVTTYVPELRWNAATSRDDDPVTRVAWSNVTVGALAAQLSGIGRDYNMGDLASQNFPVEQMGLPPLPSKDIPTCGGNDTLPPCSRQEFFHGFNKRHPVFAPETTPTYSNSAFRILGYVLEAITGSSFEEVIDNSIVKSLGLTATSVVRPTDPSRGVIPDGDSGWFQDLGDEVATGGMYSSARDLTTLASSILRSTQLSRVTTRRWLKPHAHTSAMTFSVGAPWEIWRTRSNIVDGHTVDLYTKSGSTGDYNALVILIPDYDVAISILVAGPSGGNVINIAADMAVQTFLPALEQVSKEQACQRLCGLYRTRDPKQDSSLAIARDDGPGLLIQKWVSSGVDIQAAAQQYATATGGGFIKSFRLYLTDRSEAQNGKTVDAYRAVFETQSVETRPGQPPRIFNPDLGTWSSADQLMYGGIAGDDFDFFLSKNGSATAVAPRVLREVFFKM